MITAYLHALIGLVDDDQHILIVGERHTARPKELQRTAALGADRKLKAPASRDCNAHVLVQDKRENDGKSILISNERETNEQHSRFVVNSVPSGARKCPAFVRGLCSATSQAAQRMLGSGARHSWHCSSATVRLPHARQYSHH
jgi:hypothetical protein